MEVLTHISGMQSILIYKTSRPPNLVHKSRPRHVGRWEMSQTKKKRNKKKTLSGRCFLTFRAVLIVLMCSNCKNSSGRWESVSWLQYWPVMTGKTSCWWKRNQFYILLQGVITLNYTEFSSNWDYLLTSRKQPLNFRFHYGLSRIYDSVYPPL